MGVFGLCKEAGISLRVGSAFLGGFVLEAEEGEGVLVVVDGDVLVAV